MRRNTEILWTRVIPKSPVFTTADVAAQSGSSVDVASRDLALLGAQGIITRIATGVWGYTHDPRFSAYAVVPALIRRGGPGSEGYVSLLSALSLHGMISQIPRTVHVVCNRRRERLKRTRVGSYEFYMMQPSLVGGYRSHANGTFELATPEKALFDLLFYSVRRGTRFSRSTGISLPRGFSVREVNSWMERVRPAGLRSVIKARWQILQGQWQRRSTPPGDANLV